MMIGQRHCILVTVLWGDWHRTTFLEANLPTMLAVRNLPAFASGIRCEYLIYTTAKDALEMVRSAAFQKLRALLPVSLKLFTPSKTKDPISLHQKIWQAAAQHAQRRDAFILLMPPDVAWADGSFSRLRDVLDAGKRAVFMTYPRVVSETFVPVMTERFPPNSDAAMVVPSGDMMALVMTHLHPVTAAHSRSAPHFSIHPEMVLWPIESDGFLVRLLARELFCFEPGRYPLNKHALLKHKPPDDEIYMFCDSREFLGVSLTPIWKDMEWYLRSKPFDLLFAGRWWAEYDSPTNDYLSAFNLRFTCGQASDAQWSNAERNARILMSHLRFAREFMRILLTLQKMQLSRTAAFLACALRLQGLARRWPHRGPFLILAPTDDAFEFASFHGIPGDGMSAAQAREIIENHVIAIPDRGVVENGSQVMTLRGRRVQILDATLGQPCGDNVILPWHDVLYLAPTASRLAS